MKYVFLAFSLLLLSSQVDYYDMDWVGNTMTIEAEENNSVVEEYTISNKASKENQATIFSPKKVLKAYLLFNHQVHLDLEIDPPDVLS